MVEVTGWKAIGTKLMEYSKSIEMHWEKKPEENKQAALFDE